MFNKSYRANGTDTITQETPELKIRNGVISYSSTLYNQNNLHAGIAETSQNHYREIFINYLKEQ